jgi:hypothetical protein
MTLADDLDQAARAAAAHGPVAAVLGAEPQSAERTYLVALGDGQSRRWLVLDWTLQPVQARERVREVASIVVLCELAVELAGGGRLGELRARLAELLTGERPDGIEAAEQAARSLEEAIGTPPVLASPAYLDGVGAATGALEAALGEHASPFANALAASAATVEAFVAEVEALHLLPLR